MTDDKKLAALCQIAEILGIPVSVLHSPELSVSLAPATRTISETVELLEAFDRIADPKVRRDCIAFVRKAGTA